MKNKTINLLLTFVFIAVLMIPVYNVQALETQLSNEEFEEILHDTDNWYITSGNPENSGYEIILNDGDEITYTGREFLDEIFTFNVRFETTDNVEPTKINVEDYSHTINGCCFTARRQSKDGQLWSTNCYYIWINNLNFQFFECTATFEKYSNNIFTEFNKDYKVSFGVYDTNGITKMSLYVDDILVQEKEFSGRLLGEDGFLSFRGPSNDGVRMIISKAKEEYVPATGVQLNKPYDALKVGAKSYLYVSFLPDNAIEETVVWESSDESVATVNNNGEVTAVGVGNATITATTKESLLTASCDVDVYNSIQTGYCGDSVKWVLGDGVLTISGTGDMYDYSYDYTNQSPWYNSNSSIKQIIIKEGITHIGDYAFRNTSNCTEKIIIPDSVITIGQDSFLGCGMSELVIGNGTEDIGSYAFSYCNNLADIEFGSGIKNIESNAFSSCAELVDIILPENADTIGSSAFATCKKLKNVFVPAGVKNISEDAFWGCTSLLSVNVDNKNTNYSSIDGVWFDKAVSMLVQYPQGKQETSYTIPDGVLLIMSESMSDCSALKKLTIPNSVSRIDGYAFRNCVNLTDIYYQGSEDGWNSVNNNNGNDYSGVTIHYDDNAKKVCGKNLTWELSESGTLTISGTGDMYNYEYEGAPWRTKRDSIKNVVLSEGVTSVGDYAFQYDSLDEVQLKEISLPDSIKYIGNNAFDECDSLEYITFPSGLTYIGDRAFDHTGLSSVNIPDSVTYIGESAFSGCNVETVTLGKGIKELKYYVFGRCGSLRSVLFPKDLKSIEKQAFYGCSSLETVTIPETVESFGEEAFRDCDSLKSVYIADISSWCDVEFSDYQANPLSNGGELYINGELAEKIIIPDSITTVGKYTFGGCGSISEITLGDRVSVIGEGAFHSCDKLSSVTIGSGLSSIELNAFKDCKNLLNVYYNKNKSDWDNITIESGNDQLIKASKYYISPDGGKCGDNLEWNYEDGLLIISGTGTMYDYKGTPEDPIPWESKQNIIERVVISEGVTSIGNNAFEHCENMKKIIIPSSVTKIGEGAFSHCSSLEKISIPSDVTEIEDVTFAGCGSLKEIRIPIGVTRFGAMSFMPGCDRNINVYYEVTQENWRKIEDRSSFFDMGFGNIHYSSSTNITLSKYITDKNYIYTSGLFSYISPYSVIMYGKIDGYYDDIGIKYALVKDGKQVGTMELPFMGTPTSDGAFAIRVIGKAIVPGKYTAVPYYQINSDITTDKELIITVTE